METPFFSVVIPVRNEEKLLGKTIQVLLRQIYKNFEVIIVINNSTDTSKTIAQEWAKHNPCIKVIECPGKGLLDARQTGLKFAKGDVLVQLDADNLPRTDWLLSAVEHLKDERIVVLAGAYHHNDGPAWVRFILNVPGAFFQHIFLSLGNLYVQWMGYGALMIGGNAFIRTSVLRKSGYKTSHGFMNEDLVTASALSKYGKVRFFSDLTVSSSTRRYRDTDTGLYTIKSVYTAQKEYNIGTFALLCGKEIPNRGESVLHPR